MNMKNKEEYKTQYTIQNYIQANCLKNSVLIQNENGNYET